MRALRRVDPGPRTLPRAGGRADDPNDPDGPDDAAGLTGTERETIDSLRRFVRAHGGSGTAVVSYLGRPGARIVVIAADGAFGDAVVRSIDVGRAICEVAGIDVADGWTRELSSAVRFTTAERRRMGGT